VALKSHPLRQIPLTPCIFCVGTEEFITTLYNLRDSPRSNSIAAEERANGKFQSEASGSSDGPRETILLQGGDAIHGLALPAAVLVKHLDEITESDLGQPEMLLQIVGKQRLTDSHGDFHAARYHLGRILVDPAVSLCTYLFIVLTQSFREFANLRLR